MIVRINNRHLREKQGGDAEVDNDEIIRKPTTGTQCPTLTWQVLRDLLYTQEQKPGT